MGACCRDGQTDRQTGGGVMRERVHASGNIWGRGQRHSRSHACMHAKRKLSLMRRAPARPPLHPTAYYMHAELQMRSARLKECFCVTAIAAAGISQHQYNVLREYII